MKVNNRIVNGVLYISLSGELDECKSHATRESLDALIANKSIIKVVLDFSELEFMDSTGIGVLLGRFKKLKARSIPLIIANPTSAVDKVLKISGIYSFMPKIVL